MLQNLKKITKSKNLYPELNNTSWRGESLLGIVNSNKYFLFYY